MNYGNWESEVLALLNEKNSTAFKPKDLVLTLLSTDAGGEAHVGIAPAPGVAYYNEREITYTKRDLAKSVLGIPLRLVVNENPTVAQLLALFATKYGFTFDEAIDFTEAELAKTVDFANGGVQVVEIPSAESSMVWIGKLSITVANDALDLANIIKVQSLENLVYLSGDPTKASVELATIATNWLKAPDTTIAILSTLAVDDEVDSELAEALVSTMLDQGSIIEDNGLTEALEGCRVIGINKEDGLLEIAFGPVPENDYWAGRAFLMAPEKKGSMLKYVVDPDNNNGIDLSFFFDGPAAYSFNGEDFIEVEEGYQINIEPERLIAAGTVTLETTASAIVYVTGVNDILEWSGLQQVSFNNSTINSVPKYFDTNITNATDMFNGAIFGPDVDFSEWDVSKVIDFTSMFYESNIKDNGISKWKTRSGEIFQSMFQYCAELVADLGDWVTNRANSFANMFNGAVLFNGKIGRWVTSNCRWFQNMFYDCHSFDQDISDWDVRQGVNFEAMFQLAKIFNQNLAKWRTIAATNMSNMFNAAALFKQDLTSWIVDKVEQYFSFAEAALLFTEDLHPSFPEEAYH